MWKYAAQLERPQMIMWHMCWVHKDTDTLFRNM